MLGKVVSLTHNFVFVFQARRESLSESKEVEEEVRSFVESKYFFPHLFIYYPHIRYENIHTFWARNSILIERAHDRLTHHFGPTKNIAHSS